MESKFFQNAMMLYTTILAFISPFIILFSFLGAAIFLIATIPAIIFCWLDGLDFCKKVDRVLAGDKNVKF